MEKYKFKKSLFIISIILLLGFIVKTTIDCINYDISYSAPLYLYVILNFIIFIVPAFCCVAFTKILKDSKTKEIKENNKKENLK